MQNSNSEPTVNDLLDELENITRQGKAFLGQYLIDEERAFVCTAKLRYVARAITSQTVDGAQLIERMENIIINGNGHIFGKVLIDGRKFEAVKSDLLVAIQRAPGLSRNTPLSALSPASPPATGDVLSDAHRQARQIIEQAEQEAQRIIQNARRQAGPWS